MSEIRQRGLGRPIPGAIEGMTLGIPSVALSQALLKEHYQRTATYEVAEAFAPGIIAKALKAGWPSDVILNLNFPDVSVDEVKSVEVTRQGRRDDFNILFDKRTDLRGRDYYWTGFAREPSSPHEGTDLKAIYEGRISVTPLHIDLTHQPTVHDLKGRLGGSPPRL